MRVATVLLLALLAMLCFVPVFSQEVDMENEVTEYDEEMSLEDETTEFVELDDEVEEEATLEEEETEFVEEELEVSKTNCGVYAKAKRSKIRGNGGTTYTVVKINRAHLTNPSSASLSPTASDNTITVGTACAFNTMAAAAKKSGLRLTINSGFRTLARQQYFWNCYVSKKCNGGNLAARPGTSNHGRGVALDINVASGAVYNWLAKNARKYGFIRTVPTERWHWEKRY